MKLNPIEITRETSRRLAVMGFLCACMIVLIHCTTRPSLDPNQWQWWVVNLFGADGFCRIAVPYFFVASGFFLVGKIHEGGWYFTAVKKRIRTLLIPFVVWAFIGIAFDWGMYHGIRLTGYNHHIVNPLANGAISASRVMCYLSNCRLPTNMFSANTTALLAHNTDPGDG